jgi:hypothetical protein
MPDIANLATKTGNKGRMKKVTRRSRCHQKWTLADISPQAGANRDSAR